ncbi:RNA-binding protein 39 [Dioscorea alata]|uniref:RNA-binding protein 39 n=1 Tax=Dioscorea alata TaxID=55571 RepID=A0ACB7USC1_DIOAL|nr:RNA-binding protein 39 [Dioscorea alata]
MGDFDEYDYLEQAVEAPDQEARKDKDNRSSRHREKDGESRERERFSRSDRLEKVRDHRSSRDDERAREKHWSRDGDGHKERVREKEERERVRDREKDKDRDRERERERRSSSRSRRHEKEAEREMERARSKDRALREKDLEREMREREGRRFKDKKEVVEPEVDPERDQRTVFAYQMPLKATERDIYEFFSQVGKVRDVRLIMDRNSRRSKGVGYIEFYDAMSVPNAIALSGHLLLGQPVMVKPSEAEKNLVQSNTAGASGTAGAAALRKLYVGNLHFSITEEQLRQIFEPFGPVELVQLPLDLETGQCRGYGFVQFAQLEHAKAAQSLNGKLDIAGRIIKVSAVTDHVGVQDPGANGADFDDDDGGALALNARSRAMLMQKLDRTGTASSIAESLGVPGLNGAVPNQVGFGLLPANGQPVIPSAVPAVRTPPLIEPVGEPSECLLLKNMFDPSTETEPDFDLDIKEDVQEECSKFGPLRHIYVERNSNGFVYMRFEAMSSAASCQRAMHGRWFAGRAISATFMRPADYEAKFKGSM